MPLLLLLEDNPSDISKAVDMAHRAGFTEFEINRFASDAHLYLEKGMRGEVPMPDVLVIDLDLGIESGFELLRFWHSTPQLREIPVIVWTQMGDHEREICRLFGVQRFVAKYEGPGALLDALAAIIPNANTSA